MTATENCQKPAEERVAIWSSEVRKILQSLETGSATYRDLCHMINMSAEHFDFKGMYEENLKQVFEYGLDEEWWTIDGIDSIDDSYQMTVGSEIALAEAYLNPGVPADADPARLVVAPTSS